MSIQLHRKLGVFFDTNRNFFRKSLQLFTYFYLSMLLIPKFFIGKTSVFTTHEEILFFIAVTIFSGLIAMKNESYIN